MKLRQRSEELIARADATLAMPRAEGEMWQAAPKEPERHVAPASQPRPATSPAATRGWVNKQISQTVDAIIRGVANYHAGQRRLLEMRLIEAERRIAELEQERRR